MIKIKPRRTPNDPGDSGALNDLSFLLIVFFLVIAGFNINKGFLMDIPEKNKPRIVQTEDLIKCELTKDGKIIFEEQIIDKETFVDTIGTKVEAQPNMTLFLNIHPQTPYQSVIDIIYAVRFLHVENFSFKMKDEL